MAPVILTTDVHCLRCARRIHDAVSSMHGVEKVWASVDRGLVMVTGASLDAMLLRRRIQSRTRKTVSVVSAGDGSPEESPPAGQMVHMGPTPPTLGYQYQYPYGYYGGGGWPAPPAPPLQYVPSGGGNVALPWYEHDARQYGAMMANDAPPCCRDDGPSGCCTMQ